MKRIVVELGDDFHKKMKIQAVKKELTLKDYVRELIEKDLQNEKEQTQ